MTQNRRWAAVAALLLLAAAVVLAVVVGVSAFPRGLWVTLCIVVAVPLAWFGIVHRGIARWAPIAIAGLLLVAVLLLLILVGPVLGELGVVVLVALAISAAGAAFTTKLELPKAAPPQRAVLFWNPRSGGGKAVTFHLTDEARRRGIEPIELTAGTDLRDLVRRAIEGGADALSMAGGDGSQAIVAAMAAEAGLPYACIPAGTRNHFALDLGVDRDDVVGALDAFVDGRERRVDLAEVNGQVFVNNVSLGIYAEAVQHEGYREAKLRTIFDSFPDALGPDGEPPDLRWVGPDGREHATGAAILVSNNQYRLRLGAAGTRPRLDRATLGITVFGTGENGGGGHAPLTQWTTPEFDVASAKRIPAGIDGEAVVLDAPLHFATKPQALSVRIAAQHPGASPSASLPESASEAMHGLLHIAAGRDG
jgi:diacylglycerol kinase family enzyme